MTRSLYIYQYMNIMYYILFLRCELVRPLAGMTSSLHVNNYTLLCILNLEIGDPNYLIYSGRI